MKKMYIQPSADAMILAQEESILEMSGMNGEIGYGGIDENGDKEPAVKENIFDENPFL